MPTCRGSVLDGGAPVKVLRPLGQPLADQCFSNIGPISSKRTTVSTETTRPATKFEISCDRIIQKLPQSLGGADPEICLRRATRTKSLWRVKTATVIQRQSYIGVETGIYSVAVDDTQDDLPGWRTCQQKQRYCP